MARQTTVSARQEVLEAAANAPRRTRGKGKLLKADLLEWHELPAYLRDNEFIQGSYRPVMSARGALRSLIRFHNETGNVWTHFIGFLIFAGIAVCFANVAPAALAFSPEAGPALSISFSDSTHCDARAPISLRQYQGSAQARLCKLQGSWHSDLNAARQNDHQTAALSHGGQVDGHSQCHGMQRLDAGFTWEAQPTRDTARGLCKLYSCVARHTAAQSANSTSNVQRPLARWPMYGYIAGVMICLLTSSACHLFGCCVEHVHRFIWRLDYCGIAILILSSALPPVYYGFLCSPFWRNFYLSVICAQGVAVVAVSLCDYFQHRRFRGFRALLFAAAGLFGLVPLTHMWVLHTHVSQFRAAAAGILLTGAVYMVGGMFYVLRMPERWLPGRFDRLLHSHQIFHVTVVVAATIHMHSSWVMFQWREMESGIGTPVHATMATLAGIAGVQPTVLYIPHAQILLDSFRIMLKYFPAHSMVLW